MKHKILFFAYGSIKNPEAISAILGKPENELVGTQAILEGYKLIAQRLDQVIDKVVAKSPIPKSAQELLRKNWQEDFLSYAILPDSKSRVSGIIWEIDVDGLERMRDWELVDFGWYEDCEGFATTTDGKTVSVVSLMLAPGQEIDREVDGLNYEAWSQDRDLFIKVAKWAHQIFNDTNPLGIAEQYFKLSNDSDFDNIEKLFTDTTKYISASTGEYSGRDEIMKMQKDFYAKFSSLHWNINSIKKLSSDTFLFDYDFAGKLLNGEKVNSSGLESVTVKDSKIEKVEIRNKN